MSSNCQNKEHERSKQILRNDESAIESNLRTEVVLEEPQVRKSITSISAKDTNTGFKSSSESDSFTKQHNTTASYENPSNKTSLTNLYAWGCTDLILEEYRKKGISQMFEWQAECLLTIAQVSESTISPIPSAILRHSFSFECGYFGKPQKGFSMQFSVVG